MIGGEYKRLESIGQGSFAVVYKAVHPVGKFHQHRIGVRQGVLGKPSDILNFAPLVPIPLETSHTHLGISDQFFTDSRNFSGLQDSST